jgi:hypothetical protein
MSRETGTEMKVETWKELRNEEQNRCQEFSMTISSRANLFPFGWKSLRLKCFVWWSVTLAAAGSDCSVCRNEYFSKIAKERIHQLALSPGHDT